MVGALKLVTTLDRENPSNPVYMYNKMEIDLPDEIEETDTFEPCRVEIRKLKQ